MTNEFPRKVLGYNIPRFLYGGGVVAAGNNISLNWTGGPGEILGIGILKYDGTNADMHLVYAKITIDDVVLYDYYLFALLGLDIGSGVAAHNLIGTYDPQIATFSHFSYRFKMPYDSTAQIKLTNTSAASLSLVLGGYYRYAG